MPMDDPCSACLSPTEPYGSAGGEAVACALEAAAAQFRGDAEEARWLMALLLRHVAMLLTQLGVLLRNRMQAAALAAPEMACAGFAGPIAEAPAGEPCLPREARGLAPGASMPRGVGAASLECVTEVRAERLRAGGPAVSHCVTEARGETLRAGTPAVLPAWVGRPWPDGLPVVDVGFAWLRCSLDRVFLEKRGLGAAGFARTICSCIV